MTRLVALIAAVPLAMTTLVGVGIAQAASRPQISFTQVENQFMCVICHEPLSVANAPEAFSERAYLRQLIAEGLTQRQIINRFVVAYTTAVLAKPPAHGFSLLIYILPPVLLAVGLATLFWTIPRWRRRSRQAQAEEQQQPAALDPDDERRLEADLARHI